MARLLILCCLLAGPALAQSPADPLRPPPGFGQSIPAEAESSGGEPALQSVLLAPGRQIALISGQSVAVGGQVLGYRLVSLTERSAVLHGPQGRLQIYLHPLSNPQAPARAPQAAPPQPGGRPK